MSKPEIERAVSCLSTAGIYAFSALPLAPTMLAHGYLQTMDHERNIWLGPPVQAIAFLDGLRLAASFYGAVKPDLWLISGMYLIGLVESTIMYMSWMKLHDRRK